MGGREPEYVDDPFADDDSWRYPDSRIQQSILDAGYKKYFGRGEKRKVERIEAKMQLWQPGDQVFTVPGKVVMIPTQFAEELIKWTGEQNRQAGFAKIKVSVLIGMLTDTNRISKWLGRQNADKEERRGGYV